MLDGALEPSDKVIETFATLGACVLPKFLNHSLDPPLDGEFYARDEAPEVHSMEVAEVNRRRSGGNS